MHGRLDAKMSRLKRIPCADIMGSNPDNNLCGILKLPSQLGFSTMLFNIAENLKSNLEVEEEEKQTLSLACQLTDCIKKL